jgi:hypothetical protein
MHVKVFVLIFALWIVSTKFFAFFLNCEAQQTNITHITATLSEPRDLLAATSSGELVFFGGGYNGTSPNVASDRVDICNVTSGNWTTATLSVPRYNLAATSSGNLVFFGGGANGTLYTNSTTFYDQVDIYNTSDGSWSTATLSQARADPAATSVGSLVFFVGGFCSYDLYNTSNIVDIYNVTSNTWTTATMSQARYGLAATAVANRYVLFAGGLNNSVHFNTVDIYDVLSGTWKTTTLSQARDDFAAISIGVLAFFGGGFLGSQMSNVVDIFNATSNTWSTATLSQPHCCLAAASISDIIAFGGGWNNSLLDTAVVDVYNVTSNLWFTLSLSQGRGHLAAASSANKIFFGGGHQRDFQQASNVVDIFEIPLPSSPPHPLSSPASISVAPSSSPQQSIISFSSNTFATQSNSPNAIITTRANVTGSTLPSNVVVGIVVGIVTVLLGVGLVVFLLLFIKRRRRKKSTRYSNDYSKTQNESRTVVIESEVKTMTHVNEANAATDSTYQPGTETLKSLTPGQIPLNELEISKEIGQGTYGRVCVGKWKKYRVALKFCQNKGKMDEFLREANLMISLPPHPNVVRMYGVSIDGTQPIIVMEYCAGGSLDKLLYDTEEQISNEQKIRWIREIAEGMSHLHKYNIVHRDLAARNILLSQPNLADAHLKISDFGMSRVLQRDIEVKTLNTFGPIRWMAPESIGHQVYSKKSDVWMFGVLVYEIVAQCEPHVDIDHKEAAVLIRDKALVPKIPNDCPEKLRQIMTMCWKKQPEERPTFDLICQILEE